MNATDDILSGIDLNALADYLGTDPDTALSAASAAIPTLLGSLQANASDPAGAASLLEALSGHVEGADPSDLSSVDTADGQKILGHLFADQPERLQAVGGLGGSLLSKLLPVLAPLVMSWLAKKLAGGSQPSTQQAGGGILGDLLGGLLGGAGSAAGGGLGGLGDLLGGLLGGNAPSTGPEPTPAEQTYEQPPASGTTTPGKWQIPGVTEEPESAAAAPQTDNVLGDLLNQILGRR
ncbi:MAG: DUF937 domain-containing protein [Propionibacteriaceae bacterium]|nr:DUF937 domain-containing protein [Propionibacteriaceae bacterium]